MQGIEPLPQWRIPHPVLQLMPCQVHLVAHIGLRSTSPANLAEPFGQLYCALRRDAEKPLEQRTGCPVLCEVLKHGRFVLAGVHLPQARLHATKEDAYPERAGIRQRQKVLQRTLSHF